MIEVTENMTIGNLVSRREPFTIPAHQRSYAWNSEEVSDFIADLVSLYQVRLSDPTASPSHFFGGLVSIHQNIPSTASGRKYIVVDGQQRLATFIIAFNALTDAFEAIAIRSRNEGLPGIEDEARANAEYTKTTFLEYQEVVGGRLVPRSRLMMSKSDRTFFEEMLKNSSPVPTRDSHKLLLSAREAIQKHLINPLIHDAAKSTGEKLEQLKQLSWCLTEGCFVIHIVSNDQKEAYQLFKVLNDRGRNLTDGDLLRSHTLELLQEHPEAQARVEQQWDEILSEAPSETDQFLRAYYTSQVGERAPSRDLFDKFSQHVFTYVPPLSPSQAGAVETSMRLIRDAHTAFAKLIEGEWPYEETTISLWNRDRLKRLLKVLGHTLSLPLLLSAHAQLSEEHFYSIVDLLERCAFRFVVIVGAHPSPLAKKYYEHAKSIREDPSHYDLSNLRSDLKELLVRNADDELFKANLKAKLNYSSSSAQKRVVRHFLTTIEDHYDWLTAGGSGTPRPSTMRIFDLNQVTIEHIYPQNPATQDPALEPWKQDIGNLSFWAPEDNRAAGNDSFQAKKVKYAMSGVKLTKDLADLPNWSAQNLEQRRDTLVADALKVFVI